MARILSVGTATLDLVFELDHHPYADEEMRARSLRTCRGGNAGNTAVVLSRLGHVPEFLGVLADAPETAVIERDFSTHGVAFGRCPRLTGLPPTSSIYLSGAARSIVHYRDLPELDSAAFRAMDLGGYDWLHFEGRNVTALAEMLAHARTNFPGLPVSLELEKAREEIDAVVDAADLLLCSRGFARHQGLEDPHAFLQWMARRRPSAMVTVAWGEEGAYGLAPGQAVCHAPAMKLPVIRDTLGAGDTFNAGMIDACIRGVSLEGALVHACVLAGRKCAQIGFDL